ncbi:hypothetical protein [Streptomyces sp. P9-A4]|uniref:hypothetical protein n=1 Tax=Streptomyces sp. P9-A4 TaxID=3072285 RepID=UPI002FCB56B0
MSILDRIRSLEREVRELRGRSQIRPAMNQVLNGNVTVGEGGALSVMGPGGAETLRVGKLFPSTGEFGAVIRRDDNSIAFGVYRGNAPTTQPQALRFLDADGHEIFAEDTVAHGLARPYLPLPIPTEEDVTRWPRTTSTAWTTIGRSAGIVQHPRLKIYAAMASSAGSSGQIRFLVGGTVVATASVGQPLVTEAAVPSYTYEGEFEFELQARITAGTGTVYGMTRFLYGVQS